MKRTGGLREAVLERDNLRLAFWKAARGKADRGPVRQYRARLEAELDALQSGLAAGTYPVGESTRFVIHDPKRRVIHAAAFRERVLHHALMNVCEPCFERWLIHDTYACRRGRGQWAAVRRAEEFSRRFGWFLKGDIRKYFESIPRARVLARLERRLKDPWVLAWMERLLAAHPGAGDRGLPIGSLMSQHLANLYLDTLDRWVKEVERCPGYVRYMDDFVVWDRSPGRLVELREKLGRLLQEELGLETKGTPFINRTDHGLDFLGCRVWAGFSTLNRRSRRRFRRKLLTLQAGWEEGEISELEAQRRATALCAFTAQVRSRTFRRTVLGEMVLGTFANGRQPRGPRRQLEQQREQLPFGQPQQEQPGQQEQQPGLPCRPSSNPGSAP